MEPVTPRVPQSGSVGQSAAESPVVRPQPVRPAVSSNISSSEASVKPLEPTAPPAAAATPAPVGSQKPATPLAPEPTIAPKEKPTQPTLGFNEQSQLEDTEITREGSLVLQWLTTALWGWAALVLSLITSLVFAAFITSSDTGGFTPYLIASVLVLLPVAFLCDRKYQKAETTQKNGGALAIQVVHAVVFTLISIGALVTAIYSLVNLAVGSDSSTKSTVVTLLCALMAGVYFGATAIRTLTPVKLKTASKFYPISMVVFGVILIVAAIFGPVAQERALRNDRLIEQNLQQIPQAISSYVSENDKLPSNLSSLSSLGDGPKKLIDKKLVEYRPDTKTETVTSQNGLYNLKDLLSFPSTSRKTYYYELCVEYKREHRGYSVQFGGPYDDRELSLGADNGSDYKTYVRTSGHPAGKQCYKLKTTAY